ncbi:hypothetical protein [Enterobacter roggenkampii]|uniref:hypothetical protein n=1 Tax=Enterobacter roggenkampii TaxID=1812935 RepID=UPI001E2AE074|nr:hypothetical protein [Enterobacter roggenkampii]
MGNKIITLSVAATEVLYALFFRGALQSGDLPAKSGANELRELGFAETRHTATEYQKENYFTFLTSEGQDFAIKHLVNTRFGVPSGGYIGSPLDALDEIADLPRYKIGSDYVIQKKIADALDTALARHYEKFGNTEPEKTAAFFLENRWVAIQGGYTPDEIRDAIEHIKHRRLTKEFGKGLADLSPFAMKDGQVFIKDAVIPKVQLSRTETDPRKGYAINVGIAPEMKTSAKLSPEMEKAISDVVSAELKKNLQPGGTIWNSLKRGF